MADWRKGGQIDFIIEDRTCGEWREDHKEIINDKAIECEFCERWFHAECQGVSDVMYEAIKADGEAGTNFIHWFCNSSCNFFAKKMLNNMTSLRKDLDNIAGAVGGITHRLEKIEHGAISGGLADSIRVIVRDEVKTSSDEITESMQKFENMREIMASQEMESLEDKCKQLETVSKFMDEKAREQQREQDDRSRRQTNIIVFDIPESTAEVGEDRKKDDKEKVDQILDEIGAENEPVFMKRFFKRRGKVNYNNQNSEQDNGKTQCTPMMLKFNNQASRDDVLKKFISAKKDAEEDEYEGEEDKLYLSIRMKRDMTKQERAEDFALYKEQKSRRDQSKNEGDVHARWVIRSGRVINIGRYPRSRYQQRDQHHQ